ncbi:MAG: hypothetical protein QXL18_04435 [Candidatus Woesearchaeota archaeon]
MLNKNLLYQDLLNLHLEMKNRQFTEEEYSQRLADIIYNFVKQAEIDNATGRYAIGTLIAGPYPVTSIAFPEIINIQGGIK